MAFEPGTTFPFTPALVASRPQLQNRPAPTSCGTGCPGREMLAEFLRKQLPRDETFPISLIRGSLELLTELPRASGVSRGFRAAPPTILCTHWGHTAAWRCLV